MADSILAWFEGIGTLLMGLGSCGLVFHQRKIKQQLAALQAIAREPK